MSATTTTNGSADDKQDYDAQFADLLGDLGNNSTVNGDISGVTTVTKTTEVNEDGDVVTRTTITTETDTLADGSQTQEPDLNDQGKEDKKAIDYMKARYTDKKDDPKPKIIREPKKLDHQWGKESEEELVDGGKSPLPREQDLVQYSTLGADYGRKQYESKVEREKAEKEGKVAPVPVNRQTVEKVAPPEITKNVRAMFETGQLQDLHEIKKTKINEPAPESGVYENTPVVNEGIVRSSDNNMEGEQLQKGMTKNLLNEWKTKGQNEGPKEQRKIVLAEDEGQVLENEPEVRTDVVRETDNDPNSDVVLEKGHAKNIKDKFMNPKVAPKERKAIKLVENEDAPTVYENQPSQLEGVVRADEMTDDVTFEIGKAKNLAGYWATRNDEVDIKKEAIKIDRESATIVIESEPEVLEGVVRSSDIPESEKNIDLPSGRTKNMANMWSRRSAEDGPKAPRQPIILDLSDTGPAVTENTPIERDDVVKCDTHVEDVIPGNRGRTKDIAGKFLKEEEQDTRPRKQIEIERSTGPVVLENEPAPCREGVVRSESVSNDVSLESGRTRNMVGQWLDKEQENLSPKSSTIGSVGKPRWTQEIEAARDAGGVHENEPSVNEDVIRETDIHDSEKEQLIPDNYAKSMRGVWMQKEEDEKAEKKANNAELVRFTPPREMTPPPVKQQEYQSIQKLTLASNQQNGHHDDHGVNNEEQHHTQQQVAEQPQKQSKQTVKQSASQDGTGTAPSQTVKSSTVLVLK